MALVYLMGRADSFNTTDASSGLRYKLEPPLKAGYQYEVIKFGVHANTSYAAQDTNYNTFTLYDEDGNAIASVAGGPATGGLAIGAHNTGKDTTPTSPYHRVDCSGADEYLYVMLANTGVGRAMNGIGFFCELQRRRPDA